MEKIKENWGVKLVSFFLALILWSFVLASENPPIKTNFSNVPIVLENTEDLTKKGYVIMPNFKKAVDVTLKGKRNQMLQLTNSHIRVVADLSSYKEGTQIVKLRYELPEGISVANSVDNIDLDIQKIIKKELPVTIETSGSLASDYVLESLTSSPEKLFIRGARSEVNKVEKIVANFNLDGVENNVVSNIDIYPMDENDERVYNVELGQNFVNITANISKIKEVPIKVSVMDNLNPDFRLSNISVTPGTIMIKGDKDNIEKVESISTEKIDLSLLDGDKSIDIKLKLPDNISLTSDELDIKAHIELDKKLEKTYEYPTKNILINNLSSNLDIDFDKESFKYTIYGFEDFINNINNGKMKVELDLKDKKKGTYQIKPKVKFIRENEEVEIKDIEKVKIEIR